MTATSNATNEASAPDAAPWPRLSDWMWRPWYAKLWWAGAAIFWLAVGLDAMFVSFLPSSHDGWALFLLILFHPYLIVPVLGFGFALAWIERASRSDQDDDDGEEAWDWADDFGLRRRTLNPMDPFDPRFNTLPANPASPAWIEEHAKPAISVSGTQGHHHPNRDCDRW